MVVNPFFLHGATTEQNLMQDLINEQLRMYGMDVYYIPRNFIREATIMREVTSSEFRSYFVIEAYLNNYDGYAGQGDIMSKFGIQVKDEVTLTLSRERYENYIAPFLNSRMLFLMNSPENDGELITIQRPREGDLIYFPLGRRLFEIKYVEHEQPFYQLGTNYTYELQCELFEYEDEVLQTSIDEIDSTILNKGNITTIDLVPLSNRATVDINLATGYIREFTILNEGNSFTSPPTIDIDSPAIGGDPSVIALLTAPNTNLEEPAIKQLVVFNSGFGYEDNPQVRVVGGGGNGAVIRAGVNTASLGIVNFEVTNQGAGYPEDADIVVYDADNNIVARGKALTDGEKIVQAIVTDPGEDLDATTTAVVSAPAITGTGNFLYNEIIVGKESGVRARARVWDAPEFKLQVTNIDPTDDGDILFKPGEIIEGESSGARYAVKLYDTNQTIADAYSQNEEFEQVAEVVVDDDEFNQFNPFGEV